MESTEQPRHLLLQAVRAAAVGCQVQLSHDEPVFVSRNCVLAFYAINNSL